MKDNSIDLNIQNLGILLQQLKLNFNSLQFLHNSFNNKRKQLGELNYLLYIGKKQIIYLRMCYLNHYSETINLLNTLVMPSVKGKNKEISFKYLDSNIEKDQEFRIIKERFIKCKLHDQRSKFLMHKEAGKNHFFFHHIYANLDEGFFIELSSIMEEIVKYSYKKYEGKLVNYVNAHIILHGLRKVFEESDKIVINEMKEKGTII